MNLHTAHFMKVVITLAVIWATPTWADGTITHLSGPVSVQILDGKTQPGMAGTKVSAGDTVITGVGGYARMVMTDGGEMVLRPDSQLKVESYKFAEGAPSQDNFIFSMLKGGMRAISGLISKRGNRDAYQLSTITATIGIRGTQFDLRVCQANCGSLADGTYLAVQFGAVQATNTQGSLAISAGQVAHVPPQLPPVLLPRNPGIGFTPPPVIPKLDEKKKQATTVTESNVNQAKQGPGVAEKTTQSAQGSEQSASKSDQNLTKTDVSATDTNAVKKEQGSPPTTQGVCSVQ